jgi:hypothetical protein
MPADPPHQPAALTPPDVGSPLAPVRKTPVTPADHYIDWQVITEFAPFLAWWKGEAKPTKDGWAAHLEWERTCNEKPHTLVPPIDSPVTAAKMYAAWGIRPEQQDLGDFMAWFERTSAELGYASTHADWTADWRHGLLVAS